MKNRQLISKYLRFYRALDSGERKPTTNLQRRFVAVCRGKLKPVTEHEKAYISYRNRYRRPIHKIPDGDHRPTQPSKSNQETYAEMYAKRWEGGKNPVKKDTPKGDRVAVNPWIGQKRYHQNWW